MSSYRVVETDEELAELGWRWTRGGAERLAKGRGPRLLPTYHLRIERRGLFRWAVVAYQNRAVPEGEKDG